MYDIVIIGGGVVGGMIMRELSAYDLRICMLEKENDVATGASRANSAIVHAGFDAEEGSLKAELNVAGSKMMERVAKELGVKYKRNGSLVVAFDDKDKATVEKLRERGVKNGVEGLEIVDGEKLKELEPNISDDVICALYAPSGAIVCPYELTIAAIGNAMDNGAKLYLNFEVKSIERTEDGFEIGDGNATIKGKRIINCAGINSDSIAAAVGDDSIKIHPRRGEYILLDKKVGKIVSHTIFKTPSEMGKGILITPTVDGNLLLGPTSEDVSDKADTCTTSDGLNLVKLQAAERVKNIAFNQTITSFCGLRAVGNTGDFIINQPIPGFVNVAGIESPGLTASPAIAEYVVEILKKDGLDVRRKDNFNPIRKPMHWFRESTVVGKNKVIAEDKSYGKIICRCEGVTEGEIREAIKRNPPARDLDGVKRRTRAQMGRCQGGFCMPYITEILAEELCVEYESVTKSGDGSNINVGRTKEDITK